jgi:hypothetical protein
MAVQILKLGLPGAEQTLVTESRVNDGGQDTLKSNSGDTASGNLKIDLIATKQNFSISWGVMSETDYNALYAIYLLQFNPAKLSYISTNQSGGETTTSVFMQPPSRGALIQRDEYFENGVTITMQEF